MRGNFNSEKKSFLYLLERVAPAFKQEKNMQALSDGIGIVKEITDSQKTEGGDFFWLEQGDFGGGKSTLNNKAIPHLALAREKDFNEDWPIKTLFNYTSSKTVKNVKVTTSISNVNDIIKNREEMRSQFYYKKQEDFIKTNKILEKYSRTENNILDRANDDFKMDNVFNHKKFQTLNPRSHVVESFNDSSFFRPIGRAFKNPDILRIAGIEGNNIADRNELGVAIEWCALFTNVDIFLRKGRWDVLVNTRGKKGIIIDATQQISWLSEHGCFESSSFYQSKSIFDMITQTKMETLKMSWPVINSFFKWRNTMLEEGINEISIHCEEWVDFILKS